MMKLILAILLFLPPSLKTMAQNNTGIGTASPHASAVLDVSSTNKGMLVPRLTSAQRAAIASPATGLLVFDATTESFWFKSAAAWVELVDTSNNVLKKSGNNIYTTGNTQFGIGTSTPLYDLHIKQTNANIGLTDATTNKVSATITASDEDVIINSYRSPGTGGNIILQRSSNIPALNAGNVGIGVPFTSAPMEKLQVNGNIRLQDAAAEIVLHNGTTEKGALYLSGNDVRIGTAPGNTTGRLVFSTQGATHLALSSTGELQRPNVTGGSNLLPLAFGRVGSNGVVISSTGNFSVQHVSDGFYKITLSGESNVSANQSSYVMLITPYNTTAVTSRGLMADVGIASDKIEVRLSRPKVNFDNDACANQCGPFSYIQNIKFWDEVDCEFNILIYKH